MQARRPTSGRAIPASKLRICRLARSKCRFAVPRTQPSLTHRPLPGHCLEVVVRPKSRGCIRLTGPKADDPIQIEANTLSHPDDLKAAIALVELCREVGNSVPLRPFTKREVMPGNLRGTALEDFIRDAAATYHHQTCTAKMGRDSMSVVDAGLRSMGSKTFVLRMGPSCHA